MPMNTDSVISVGVSSDTGRADRVAVTINGVAAYLTPSLARQIAVQIIMIADFLHPPNQENGQTPDLG